MVTPDVPGNSAAWRPTGGIDLHPHHHREYPVAQPGARQHGPGTHGDPDGILTGALDSDGFEYEQRSAPAYAPTDAVVRDSRRS